MDALSGFVLRTFPGSVLVERHGLHARHVSCALWSLGPHSLQDACSHLLALRCRYLARRGGVEGECFYPVAELCASLEPYSGSARCSHATQAAIWRARTQDIHPPPHPHTVGAHTLRAYPSPPFPYATTPSHPVAVPVYVRATLQVQAAPRGHHAPQPHVLRVRGAKARPAYHRVRSVPDLPRANLQLLCGAAGCVCRGWEAGGVSIRRPALLPCSRRLPSDLCVLNGRVLCV